MTALRSALAAVENAESVPVDRPVDTSTGEIAGAVEFGSGEGEVARRELSEDDVRAIVEGERGNRTAAAQEYQDLGRPDDAARLRAEADVLARYLTS